jgi:hypothetical protein
LWAAILWRQSDKERVSANVPRLHLGIGGNAPDAVSGLDYDHRPGVAIFVCDGDDDSQTLIEADDHPNFEVQRRDTRLDHIVQPEQFLKAQILRAHEVRIAHAEGPKIRRLSAFDRFGFICVQLRPMRFGLFSGPQMNADKRR